jgi:hypothetical protein
MMPIAAVPESVIDKADTNLPAMSASLQQRPFANPMLWKSAVAVHGRCPGFVLMMTTILALVAVSVITAIVTSMTATDGLNALANP